MKNSAILLALVCATTFTATLADVSHLGYHYERNSLNGGGGGYKYSEGYSGSLGFGAQSLQQQQQPQPQYQNSFQLPTPTQQLQGPAQGFNGGDKYSPPASTTHAPIVTKQFYLVSAPEEPEDIVKTKHFVLGRPQKNYRVVFIKAPSPENTNIKLTAEYAPQEEKTVIYVLSKKANELDIGEIPQPTPTQPTKPEVFFIKYKTQEEASAAQKEIQEQYDHLGGTSEFTDAGIVPVKSVVGSLDGQGGNGGYDYRRGGGQGAPHKEYLPPARYYL